MMSFGLGSSSLRSPGSTVAEAESIYALARIIPDGLAREQIQKFAKEEIKRQEDDEERRRLYEEKIASGDFTFVDDPPEILNAVLDDLKLSTLILGKLPPAWKMKWMKRRQARISEKFMLKSNPVEKKPEESKCQDAQLSAGLPLDCFSALSGTENGMVDAAEEYKTCENVLILFPVQGGEDELVCTSVAALVAGMKDSHRVRYECTSQQAIMCDDHTKVSRKTAQRLRDNSKPSDIGGKRKFDLPMDSFGLEAYAPISIGIEQGYARNGYFPEGEIKQLIDFARAAINDPSKIRLFTAVHEETIPFTVSRRLGPNPSNEPIGSDDWLGASHCQFGSTIEVYSIREVALLAAAIKGDMKKIIAMATDKKLLYFLDADGKNALELATEHGHPEVADVLRIAMADNSKS